MVAWCLGWSAACGATAQVDPDIETPAGTGGRNHPDIERRAHVVLISFDGFRHDYLDRYDTPYFDRLAAEGMMADGLEAVFPSMTFPTHYSIATGMHPEAHGIVDNRFFDPERNAEFNYRDRASARDGTWWGGEPIWLTAETHGMVAAAFFFPGTEADIGGLRPTHWRPYAGETPNTQRVEQVITWLSLPAAERPHLVTLYFSLVDSAGHRLGPDAAGTGDAIVAADRLLGQLLDGIDTLAHGDRVAVVAVSDHGMAAPDGTKITVLPEIADLRGARLIPAGTGMRLYLDDPTGAAALRDTLNAAMPHATAYLREEVPADLHHRATGRVGDVVVIPDGLGMVRFRRDGDLPTATHGWAPTVPAMRGIFIAAGPGVWRGVTLDRVRHVDIYPLIAHLLELPPHDAVAGTLEVFERGLLESR